MLSTRRHQGPTESPTRGCDFPESSQEAKTAALTVQVGKLRPRPAKPPPGSGPPHGYFSCSAPSSHPPRPTDSCLPFPSRASPFPGHPRPGHAAAHTLRASCPQTGPWGVPCAAVPGESSELGDDGKVSAPCGPPRRRLCLLAHPRTHAAPHHAWHTVGAQQMSNGVTEPANAVARLERLPPPLRPGAAGTEGWALVSPHPPVSPAAQSPRWAGFLSTFCLILDPRRKRGESRHRRWHRPGQGAGDRRKVSRCHNAHC